MVEFDYQWENLLCVDTEYNEKRIRELLKFTKLNKQFFDGKFCLDAGCGNGRYTYAMQQLGAKVTAFDISSKAVEQCVTVNPEAYVFDLMKLEPNPIYDFVLSWGVLHHLEHPLEGFSKVASQVKQNGLLHIMVYHKDTQKQYRHAREKWKTLSLGERLDFARDMVRMNGGHLHGWFDALNPKYNFGFEPKMVKRWFEMEGFKDVRLTQKYNINMQGTKT